MRKFNKYIFTLLGFLLITANALACPVCEKQQPKITAGLTHGTGPQSNWDWVIIAIMSLITILTLIFSIKFLVKPGERNRDHIKLSIFNNQIR